MSDIKYVSLLGKSSDGWKQVICDTDGKLLVSNSGGGGGGGGGGAVTNAGTFAVQVDGAALTSLQLIDDVVGTDSSTGPGKCISIGGTESGGNIQELLVDSTGHLQVDVLSTASHAVTNAGTFAVQVDGDALTSLQLLDDVVGTDGSTGPDKCISIGGTESGGNIQELLVDAQGHLQIDVLSTASHAVSNAGTFAVQSTLQASSAAIGKLAANSGVNIGDINVKGNTSVSGGTSTEKYVLCDAQGHLQIDVLSVPTTTITGTVTANLSSTDNTVLNNILTKITANEILLTAANSDHTGNKSHLNTIAGDTTSIDGKITACNTGAVVLAAGSAAIGKLAANSGVNIGDVTNAGTFAVQVDGAALTSLQLLDDVVGTDGSTGPGKCISIGGTDGDGKIQELLVDAQGHLQVDVSNLGKAEDTAHSSGDVGVMTLAVRQDSQADFGADGDYVPLSINGGGELRVTSGNTLSEEEIVNDEGYDIAATSFLKTIDLDDLVVDTIGYKNILIYGIIAGGYNTGDLNIFGCNSNTGTYIGLNKNIEQKTIQVTSGGPPTIYLNWENSISPRYLKIHNSTGNSITLKSIRWVGYPFA